MVVNFASSLIICEIDDLIMYTGRVSRIKDQYDSKEDERFEEEHEIFKEGEAIS